MFQQIDPYLPYEFTCEGMLQRMNAFIERQVWAFIVGESFGLHWEGGTFSILQPPNVAVEVETVCSVW